jgi:hypothetical protein
MIGAPALDCDAMAKEELLNPKKSTQAEINARQGMLYFSNNYGCFICKDDMNTITAEKGNLQNTYKYLPYRKYETLGVKTGIEQKNWKKNGRKLFKPWQNCNSRSMLGICQHDETLR